MACPPLPEQRKLAPPLLHLSRSSRPLSHALALAALPNPRPRPAPALALAPAAWTLDGRADTFWSSRGSAAADADAWLLYKLAGPLCAVRCVQLAFFRANYQFGGPVYPAVSLSFQCGPSPARLAPPTARYPARASDHVRSEWRPAGCRAGACTFILACLPSAPLIFLNVAPAPASPPSQPASQPATQPATHPSAVLACRSRPSCCRPRSLWGATCG